MKANFALSLSFDGILLLHRAAGGWRRVGDVSLDDPQIRASLEALRQRALALEPEGLRTKLLIPTGQIKYLTIDTPAADETQRRAAAVKALDGATPYRVDELAFDISPDGDQTHIAAVAMETLTEAEAFAVEHAFAPISIVTAPADEGFLGEPFFGATSYARGLLTPGEDVEPDHVAVVEVGEQFAQAAATVDVEIPAPVAEDVTPPEPVISAAPAETGPAKAPPIQVPPVPPTPEGRATESAEPPAPVPGFSSRRARKGQNPPPLAGVTRSETPAKPSPREAIQSGSSAVEQPSEPTFPSSGVLNADVPGDPQTLPPAVLPEPGIAAASLRNVPVIDDYDPYPERSAHAASYFAENVATGAPIPRSRQKATSERQQMTIFGARVPEGPATIGGKPRFLGLVLTAMLLLFLAGVAAWATVFRGDDGLSGLFAPRTPTAPFVTEEVAPVLPAPEPDTPQIETASLSPALPPEQPLLPAPSVDEVRDDIFDPERARAEYAVTGIWSLPPRPPSAPPLLGLDDLYITSIDRKSLSFDAVAMVPASAFVTDVVIRRPADPAPPGTRFTLDPRGLVVPTPDGALSPQGVQVFLGRPPVVPPTRPAVAAEPVPENTQADPTLVAFRPKARPDNLIEQNERTQLGGYSRAELAALRPRARPATAKIEDEADETPTEFAAAVSKRPAARPKDFGQRVAAVRAQPQTEAPATQAVRAAVSPRTVQPKIPSSASVTKQATVRNAINLNRINLMGVYGTPSNRRALVRLANGRYKKVQVGDRIDGGKVSAIGDSELRYQKGSRNIVLKMPRT